MSRHAETGNVDADDAHAVDDFRQPIQRHARRRRDTQIDHHDTVIIRRLRGFVHRVADVLVKLPAHQRFGVERHIADGPFRPIEMRGERQAVNATRRPGQDRRRPPHAQADSQRPEGRAHRLRLIMWTARIVFHQLVQRLALAGGACRFDHRFTAAVTARTGLWRNDRSVHLMTLRRSLRGTAFPAATRRTCLPASPDRARHRGRPRRRRTDPAACHASAEFGRTGGAIATCSASCSNTEAHWPPGLPMIS